MQSVAAQTVVEGDTTRVTLTAHAPLVRFVNEILNHLPPAAQTVTETDMVLAISTAIRDRQSDRSSSSTLVGVCSFLSAGEH